MTEHERLITLEDARAVMASAGETLRKVSEFLATTAGAPDFRALLAALLPYAESRAEDLQEAKDEGKEDSAYPGAADAWAAVQAAHAALGGDDAPPWVIGSPYQALRAIIAFEEDREARMMVRSAAAYVKIVDMARAGLAALPSEPAVPPPTDEARDIIYRLIEWADFTGWWEAPIWDEARAYFLRTRRNPENDQPHAAARAKVDAVSARLDVMTEVFQAWCEAEQLPQMSADELLLTLFAEEKGTRAQYAFLRHFIDQWEAVAHEEAEAFNTMFAVMTPEERAAEIVRGMDLENDQPPTPATLGLPDFIEGGNEEDDPSAVSAGNWIGITQAKPKTTKA